MLPYIEAVKQLPCCVCSIRARIRTAAGLLYVVRDKGAKAAAAYPASRAIPLCLDHRSGSPISIEVMGPTPFFRHHGLDPQKAIEETQMAYASSALAQQPTDEVGRQVVVAASKLLLDSLLSPLRG